MMASRKKQQTTSAWKQRDAKYAMSIPGLRARFRTATRQPEQALAMHAMHTNPALVQSNWNNLPM
jgi:hypothetical protein